MRRELDLVSISKDGLQIPEIYFRVDIHPDTVDNLDYDPSPLESVDEISVVEFLEQDAIFNIANYQDPDAQFNALFTSIPRVAAGGGTGTLVFSSFEVPDNYTMRFRNGTSIVVENQVLFLPGVNFTGINSGEIFHKVFEIPSSTTGDQEPSTSATDSSTPSLTATRATVLPTVPGYPLPISKEDSGAVAAYALEEDGYLDVVVLAVLSFLPISVDEADFSDTQEIEFLKAARVVITKLAHVAEKEKRDKLVIDLSANGGGSVKLAIEIYRLLFPDGEMTTFDRMRANAALGEASAASFKAVSDTILGTRFLVDSSGHKIDSGDVFFGPYNVTGENVTIAFVDDLSKPLGDEEKFYYNGFEPNGTVAIEKAPFKPENILIVTDGTCASACDLLTGLLSRTFQIKTLALGGRPLELPMQAMGGVKGTEVNTFSFFQEAFAEIKETLKHDQGLSSINATYLPSQNDAPLLPSIDGDSRSAVNSHSGFTIDDLDGCPLQFRYEAAHCRLFYTSSMVADVTETWRRVANIAWGNGTCVPGSTTNSDGPIGSNTVAYNVSVLSRANPMQGPGTLNFTSNTLNTTSDASNITGTGEDFLSKALTDYFKELKFYQEVTRYKTLLVDRYTLPRPSSHY